MNWVERLYIQAPRQDRPSAWVFGWARDTNTVSNTACAKRHSSVGNRTNDCLSQCDGINRNQCRARETLMSVSFVWKIREREAGLPALPIGI